MLSKEYSEWKFQSSIPCKGLNIKGVRIKLAKTEPLSTFVCIGPYPVSLANGGNHIQIMNSYRPSRLVSLNLEPTRLLAAVTLTTQINAVKLTRSTCRRQFSRQLQTL